MNLVFSATYGKADMPAPEILVLDASRYPTLITHWPGTVAINKTVAVDDHGAVTVTNGGQRK